MHIWNYALLIKKKWARFTGLNNRTKSLQPEKENKKTNVAIIYTVLVRFFVS